MSANQDEQEEEVNDPSYQISNVGHTLLNHVVASRLFEVVNFSQLRTLRLVCREWHSLSLPIWRKTLQINIHAFSSNNKLLQWKSLGSLLDVAEEQPFRNFRLDTPQFLSDISRPYIKSFSYPTNMNPANFEGTYMNMENFWEKYGHWIHKLELMQVYMTNVEAFKRAIFKQTPNLQELTLDRIIDGRDAEESDPLPIQCNEDEGPVQPNLKTFAMKKHTKLPFGWKLISTRFPNIEKLELSEPNSIDEFIDFVENMLRNPARRPNLLITDLRLGDRVAGGVKRLLRKPQVKLKVLHLTLYGRTDEDLDVLRTAMQLHGQNLTELHLRHNFEVNDFWGCLEGPYGALTELDMEGTALALNLHFLLKFPNLKVLRLEQAFVDDMVRSTDWTSLEKMPHLREFSFIVSSLEGFLSRETLERFGELMPNLESFTGQLTKLTLPVVCRNWRKLRKLVINSGLGWTGVGPADVHVRGLMDIDDVGITGIFPGSDERVPCVADLQELCHLTLENVTLIGDASVFDGFFKLPHLCHLNICEATEILEGLEALRNRLQGGFTITPLCL